MRKIILLFVLFSMSFSAIAEDKVAVVVYGQNANANQYLRVVQTRMEQLLNDNGVVVIDQKKAEELKKSWKQLSDPGALITAEEYVEMSTRYKISGIYRVYLGVGKSQSFASVFSTTATADMRFIGGNALVKSAASAPMGTKGIPPSDGLTESAAINNAIQRAVDSSAEKLGIKVMDTTNPRLVKFSLKAVQDAPVNAAVAPLPTLRALDDSVTKLAKLASDDWTSEEVTCVRASPDGRMAAIGTYVIQTAFNYGKPTRTYASQLHVVDLDAKNEVEHFDVSNHDPRYQRGGSKITDCLFLGSWRYVAAVSQSHLIFSDTERGVELGRVYFEDSFSNPTLQHLHSKEGDYLAIKDGSRQLYFQIVRE